MRSDTLKRHMSKHRELHTSDEEEIRDVIKRSKKLRETREGREQLVKQIADEEGLRSLSLSRTLAGYGHALK